jgi:Ca2+-binding EF-hand superfamily protein
VLFSVKHSSLLRRTRAKKFYNLGGRTFDTDHNGYIDFKEFLLAIDVTSSGCPEEKLNWAFRYIFAA